MKKIKSFIKKSSALLNYPLHERFLELNNRIDQLEKKVEVASNLDNLDNKINDLNRNINDRLDNLSHVTKYVARNFNYSSSEINRLVASNSNNKKVLICGFYGAQNLGDELMLESLLRNLPKSGYEYTIMVCDKENIDYTFYGDYNFIHYPLNTADLNVLANIYDCVIFGGGALLDDDNYEIKNNYDQMTLGYILINLSMRFIAFNKTTILYGLSANSHLSNGEFISKLSYIADNATYFSLRDTYSKECLEKRY